MHCFFLVYGIAMGMTSVFQKPGKGGVYVNEKQIFVNKEHKDNVFRILYRDDKKRQIELYNAVSGKNYTEDADLEVVTLKHAIYMGMKNDLAFIVSDDLHLDRKSVV